MFQSNLPKKYWGEASLTVVYLINRMPTAISQDQSPFQVLHNVSPSYEHLKTFGCLCFASTLKRQRDKLQPRANPCIFLGYPYGQKAYKLLDLKTNKVFTSRDVIFHENIFPFHHIKIQSSAPLPAIPDFFIYETTDFQEPNFNSFSEQSSTSTESL